jgi:hypothetical protein
MATPCSLNLGSFNMKIYAAGWALQSPALNLFKRFLRLNPDVEVSGVIYPKKIPFEIDGIPVLDFDAARKLIKPGDIVLNTYRPAVSNEGLSAAFINFLDELDIKTTNVGVFVSSMIAQDQEGALKLPIEGVTSADIRLLQDVKYFTLANGMFANIESSCTARKLDEIVRNSSWEEMLEFDHEETPDSVLFEIISDLCKNGYANNFRLLNASKIFLNVLLKIKGLHPEDTFRVELDAVASKELGSQLDFFKRTLNVIEMGKHKDVVLLSNSTKPIVQAFHNAGKASPAIFFMRRSILDYYNIVPLLDSQKHRILLRQVDTSPTNLIASLVVHDLFKTQPLSPT